MVAMFLPLSLQLKLKDPARKGIVPPTYPRHLPLRNSAVEARARQPLRAFFPDVVTPEQRHPERPTKDSRRTRRTRTRDR